MWTQSRFQAPNAALACAIAVLGWKRLVTTPPLPPQTSQASVIPSSTNIFGGRWENTTPRCLRAARQHLHSRRDRRTAPACQVSGGQVRSDRKGDSQAAGCADFLPRKAMRRLQFRFPKLIYWEVVPVRGRSNTPGCWMGIVRPSRTNQKYYRCQTWPVHLSFLLLPVIFLR